MRFRVSNVVCRCTHRRAHTRRPRPGVRVRVRVRPVVCHGQPSFHEVKVSGERETSVTRECCVPTLVVGPGTDGDGRGGAGRGECPRSNRHSPTLPPRPSSLVPPSRAVPLDTSVTRVCRWGLVVAETDAEGGRTVMIRSSRTDTHTHPPPAPSPASATRVVGKTRGNVRGRKEAWRGGEFRMTLTKERRFDRFRPPIIGL